MAKLKCIHQINRNVKIYSLYAELSKIIGNGSNTNISLNKMADILKKNMFSHFQSHDNKIINCTGISSGCAYGRLIKSARGNSEIRKYAEPVILISENSSFCDLKFIERIHGLIILDGGLSSHAAIVARSMCIPTVLINDPETCTKIMNMERESSFCCIDGTYGKLSFSYVQASAINYGFIQKIKKWNLDCDRVLKHIYSKKLQVMANADTESEVQMALGSGASGIGSCRIEHMFLSENRLSIMQGLLLLPDGDLFDKYCVLQKQVVKDDIIHILSKVSPRPCTIRLLDAIPDEFLSDKKEDVRHISHKIGISEKDYWVYYSNMCKDTGMSGVRGCRLGMLRKKIYLSQIQAIMDGVEHLLKAHKKIDLRVIVPFVSNRIELAIWEQHLNKKMDFIVNTYPKLF